MQPCNNVELSDKEGGKKNMEEIDVKKGTVTPCLLMLEKRHFGDDQA
jgi:hypothetical protein